MGSVCSASDICGDADNGGDSGSKAAGSNDFYDGESEIDHLGRYAVGLEGPMVAMLVTCDKWQKI